MTATQFEALRKGLNQFDGSSAGGCLVIIDLDDASVGTHLFTRGSRPHLAPHQRLVEIGRYVTSSDLRSIIGDQS